MQGSKWIIFHQEQRVYIRILYKQQRDVSICDASSLAKYLKYLNPERYLGEAICSLDGY